MNLADRLKGTLLGTAVGDSLGLPAEGLSAETILRRFGRMERFHLLGRVGFVSDDTEQSALVAQSLARHPGDLHACVAAFRRSLLGWFLRLPWGIGLATVRACCRMALGFRESGVASAGNGAAMRASVVGVFFHDRPDERRAFGAALARVTHTDPRAVEAALFCAEAAALCCRARGREGTQDDRLAMMRQALEVIKDAALKEALGQALKMSGEGLSSAEAGKTLGNTGYSVHTAALAAWCFIRYGGDALGAVAETISAGGDTDTIAAIVGAWVGALHGEEGLPQGLISAIHDGPFGPSHLRSLGDCLAEVKAGARPQVPAYCWPAALARNLALYPVVLAHGLRRLLPF
ncbi:MAG: ADP-ribosylglycohydrolase family protein [Elusimicrobia bacterium]|nr:ADP-ribosylglycohydrolase family protein [Elusimicrobiota bacterium]